MTSMVGRTSRSTLARYAIPIITAIAGLFVLAGHASAASWLPQKEVSAPQSSATPPGCGFLCFSSNPGAAGVDVAVDAQGNAVAAWTRRDDTNVQRVQAAFRPAGGSFGAAQTIGTTQSYFFGIFGPLADVAMDAAGNAVLVWPTTKNGFTVVQSSVRPAGGSFGAPVDLTTDDQSAFDPRVAMSAGGEAIAVWTRSNGTDTIAQASRKPAGSTSFGPPTNLSQPGPAAASAEGNASNARVALNDQGAAAVTWVRNDPSNTIVQARVRPAGSTDFSAVLDLSATGQSASTPEVAIDNAGRSTYVWARPDGTRTRIQSRFLTAAGAFGAGVDDLSSDDRNGSSPQVALDPNNTAVALWVGCPTAGGSCIVESASRPSNGSFGQVDPVSPPVDSQFLPQIEMDAAGTATAAWSDFTTARIRAARRPRGGSFGDVDDLSPTPGSAFLPALAADNQGNVVAGWPFTRPAPDNRQVAQVTAFDAAAPALSNVSVPGSVTTGTPAGMSASASDRWSGASISWTFGDGGTGSGGTVSHAYSAKGVYNVTVRATDGAGNSSSATRTIQVSDPPSPPGGGGGGGQAQPTRILIAWPFAFSKSTNKFTRFTALKIKVTEIGASLKVVCKAPKKKKCPGGRSFSKANAFGTTNLKKWLKKKLPAGTTLTATVTKPGNFIGAVKVMKVRKKKRPSFSDRCILPGTSKAVSCP